MSVFTNNNLDKFSKLNKLINSWTKSAFSVCFSSFNLEIKFGFNKILLINAYIIRIILLIECILVIFKVIGLSGWNSITFVSLLCFIKILF